LLIEELILSAGGNVYRVLDINEAVDFLGSIHHIDLIVINISLVLATQNEIVHYLKKEYSVPVVVVLDNNVERNCRSLKVVDWFDCAVSINLDANSLCETLVELVNNTYCKTVT
jgi:CheY-like chemotaxis protein